MLLFPLPLQILAVYWNHVTPCLSGCAFNLYNPRPQLDENLVLLKHVFCSGDCEYHFNTQILAVWFYCVGLNYSEKLVIHLISTKANTTVK